MSAFFISTVVFLYLAFSHWRQAWRGGKKNMMLIMVVFMTAGYVILVLTCMNIHLSSPITPVENLIRRVFNIIP